MVRRRDTALHRLGRRNSLAYWAAAERRVGVMGLRRLREEALRAEALRATLDRVLTVTARRLDAVAARPRDDLPTGSDWSLVPDLWQRPVSPSGYARPDSPASLGHGLKCFHDSRSGALTVAQRRRPGGGGYDLVVESYRFEGTFFSLVADIPREIASDLDGTHLIGLQGHVTVSRPMEMFVRFNLASGPNTDAEVQEVHPDAAGRFFAEFEMAHRSPLRTGVEGAWLDLIVDLADMAELRVTDLCVTRRRRAEL